MFRLSIDNRLVYEGHRKLEIPYTFKSGRHLVEVRYFNDWKTTDFSLTFERAALRQAPVYSVGIAPKMDNRSKARGWNDDIPINIRLRDVPVTYFFNRPRLAVVGLTRVKSEEKDVTVILDKMPSPVILLLMSSFPVNWHVKNAGENELLQVIHGLNSRVYLDSPGNIPLSSQSIGDIRHYLDGTPSCQCLDGFYYCNHKPMLPLINAIQVRTGTLVHGYTFTRDTSTVMAPETVMETSMPSMIQDYREYQSAKQACEATYLPDFERMIDS